MKNSRYYFVAAVVWLSLIGCSDPSDSRFTLSEKIDLKVQEYMRAGDIPGLSLVTIKDSVTAIRSYGYADVATKKSVADETLFELGSCTKAYTALIITYLETAQKLELEKNVSYYLPWFYTTYKDSTVEITLRQLLHHTGGIPWNTISKIPESAAPDALEKTVREISGQELDHLPGEEFEYATVNYDILALIAQVVTGKPFETLAQEIILEPLQLTSTKLGAPADPSRMSTGYKISFLEARPYKAPRYRGNNAAGYMVSDARDVSKWLAIQLGATDHPYKDLIKRTHERDGSVALHGMSSYARGWNVNLDGTGEIFHDGLNPNFSAYLCFRPNEGLAIAVLANANSNYTSLLGDEVMKMLAGEKLEQVPAPGDNGDSALSLAVLAIAFYLLIATAYFVYLLYTISKGERKPAGSTSAVLMKITVSVLAIIPFLAGLYFLPGALLDFNWSALYVWTPQSALAATYLLIAAIGLSYLNYFIGAFFPAKDKLKGNLPSILVMTMLSGLSNVVIIMMVTSVIGSEIEVYYLLGYYTLVAGLYVTGRRFIQVNLIRITRGAVLELRMKLIDKIFSTSYDRFERIDRGKVYTVLNDDVNAIGESTNRFVGLITCIITVIGALVYLAALAFWATLLTVGIIVMITTLYYFVSQGVNKYYEEARDSRNTFMGLLNSLIDGYKEISLKRSMKLAFKRDVEESAERFKTRTSTADIMFANAFLIGESFLIVLLGFVAIVMCHVFPSIQYHTIVSFVIVFLYLISPVNAILHAVPDLLNMRIAWHRVQHFNAQIPVNLDLGVTPQAERFRAATLELRNISFQYGGDAQAGSGFRIGPIDFKAQSGEIVFITGGNGSGKTTFAKILTGLYIPQGGEVLVNDRPQKNYELSEYFSAVFNPPYLFDKLYGVNLDGRKKELEDYLVRLDLHKKVRVEGNAFSTIALSNGQRKRLALLQCYLEDSPICLFDEWAADQDPQYKHFFYHTILPGLKAQNKIVIAITHDDHYFHTADHVFKMDQGAMRSAQKNEAVAVNVFLS